MQYPNPMNNSNVPLKPLLPSTGFFVHGITDLILTAELPSLFYALGQLGTGKPQSVRIHYSSDVVGEVIEVKRFVDQWNIFAAAQNYELDKRRNSVSGDDLTLAQEIERRQLTFFNYLPTINGVNFFDKTDLLPGDEKNGLVGVYRKLLIEIAATRFGKARTAAVDGYIDTTVVDDAGLLTLNNLSELLFGKPFFAGGRSSLSNPNFSGTKEGVLDYLKLVFGETPGFQEFVNAIFNFPRRILAVRNNLLVPEDGADYVSGDVLSRRVAISPGGIMHPVTISATGGGQVSIDGGRFTDSVTTDVSTIRVRSTQKAKESSSTSSLETGLDIESFVGAIDLLLNIFLEPMYGTTKVEVAKREKSKALLKAHLVKDWAVSNNILREVNSLFADINYSAPKGVDGKEIKKLLSEFKAKFGSANVFAKK